MLVEQISVFIENKKGRLSEIAEVLAQNNIDISALSLADTDEYGVLRMIVTDPHKAKKALADHGVIGKVTTVLAVAIEDRPGGFYEALTVLTDNGVEIKYMYACVSHEKGKALMILSVENPVEVEKMITQSKDGITNPSAIYRI
ncbi:MAG: ACT domain-containing protein [Clostridia bacterium]|nr:ACT domain-containing protein [Clostridia bacterium]